ncbi:MAG TPA: lmo0937 family membrane protein [Methylotenera sp.]|nr:lmo0937 family membrane protein [Methylotenera sp.]
MLNVTAFVLIVIWLVGVTSNHQMGSSIHILLLAGIVIFIYKTTKKPRHSEHFESNKQLQLARVHKKVNEDAINRLRR